ncbi:MAG: type I glutamate--ammonia ligase [Candidatus Aminicenantia bacterium]
MLEKILKLIERENIKALDLKFCDLPGRWHHVTIPCELLTEEFFEKGVGFDSSNFPGFRGVEEGDMNIIPDPETAFIDPFWNEKTLSFICDIVDSESKSLFKRSPRSIARRAEEYLKETGIADMSLWGPEYEFYIFDSLEFSDSPLNSFIKISSLEARETGNQEICWSIKLKGGYHSVPPYDRFYQMREEIVRLLQESGVSIKYHHHEVGAPGQEEIEVGHQGILKTGDWGMMVKYIVRNLAKRHGKFVSFLPKPVFNEAGNGLHFHQYLTKNGKSIFYDPEGLFSMSKIALYYIGGLLFHAPSLSVFTNPSTNSYKRLVPGFEAPTNIFFDSANRTAAIRIPKHASPLTKRIEYRPPDATCNIYLATSAQLLAGIDGILNKIDPLELGFGPFKNSKEFYKSLPSSLSEAIESLKKDYKYLLQGGVFTEDLIEFWIEYKMKEASEVSRRTVPLEFEFYNDI